jgi:hypothetical protein
VSNKFVQIGFGLGNEVYITPCFVCGAPVKTWVKRRNVKFKCREYKQKEKELQKEKSCSIKTLTSGAKIRNCH